MVHSPVNILLLSQMLITCAQTSAINVRSLWQTISPPNSDQDGLTYLGSTETSQCYPEERTEPTIRQWYLGISHSDILKKSNILNDLSFTAVGQALRFLFKKCRLVVAFLTVLSTCLFQDRSELTVTPFW